jgi:ABC-2 type transport system permease protein
MPGLAGGIAQDIRDGNLKKYLLQPIDMTAYLLAYRGAHKLAYIVSSLLPYGLLFWWFHEVFPPFPDAVTFLAYLTSLILAFLLGFFFEAAIGMVGFWLLEVTSFLWVVNTVNYFVSGQMFPIDVLDAPAPTILKATPFPFLAYWPAMIFLGKVPPENLAYVLIWELFWVIVLMGTTRLLYLRGLRRYGAYGG